MTLTYQMPMPSSTHATGVKSQQNFTHFDSYSGSGWTCWHRPTTTPQLIIATKRFCATCSFHLIRWVISPSLVMLSSYVRTKEHPYDGPQFQIIILPSSAAGCRLRFRFGSPSPTSEAVPRRRPPLPTEWRISALAPRHPENLITCALSPARHGGRPRRRRLKFIGRRQ